MFRIIHRCVYIGGMRQPCLSMFRSVWELKPVSITRGVWIYWKRSHVLCYICHLWLELVIRAVQSAMDTETESPQILCTEISVNFLSVFQTSFAGQVLWETEHQTLASSYPLMSLVSSRKKNRIHFNMRRIIKTSISVLFFSTHHFGWHWMWYAKVFLPAVWILFVCCRSEKLYASGWIFLHETSIWKNRAHTHTLTFN